MKRWPVIMLVVAPLLAVFDGVATYFELTRGLVTEGNLVPSLIQAQHGLEGWLLFHFAASVFFAMVATYMFCRQRYGVVIAWFAIEVFLCFHHLWILVWTCVL